MDSILLTSIPLGPTEPWSWDQQNPTNMELPPLNHDASAVLSESPEKMEPSPNPQETSTQLPLQQEVSTQSTVSSEPFKFLFDHRGIQDKLPSYPEYDQSSKSSALPPVPLADIQTSSVDLKNQGQLPKPSIDGEAQPSVHQEATSSLPDWGEVQHQVLSLSVGDVDMGILIKPKPPKKKEAPATAKEVSFYPPRPTENIKPPYQQETPGQPVSQADVLQQTAAPLKYSEVTLPRPQPVQAQQPAFPPMHLELTITPEPTLVTDAVTQQQTIAPPKQPNMALPYPEPVQTLQPTLSDVRALSFDMDFAKTQQPDSYEIVPPVTEQSATMNICEFCTCSIGTLSCIGFGTNQKLNEVPVPEPSTYNGTITILNLQGNAISYIGKDTWKSYHLVEKLILNRNPLTTVQDPYLFNLPALKYLDMGATHVSLTTVDNILKMTLTLEKLILPNHLACCLCQYKNIIEAVAKSIKLHCDNMCLAKTHCDEKVLTEGPFMKILQGRKNYNNTELTIEPERASSKKNSDTLSAFMSLLMKLLDEQQEVKVSKGEWDTEQWKNDRMEAPGEQEEEESYEFTKEVPGFKNYNKVIIASPVIAVVAFFFVVFCLIAICRSKESTNVSSRGSLASDQQNKSAEYQLEEGGFWRRLFVFLKNLFAPLLSICQRKSDVKTQDADENEAFLKMEQAEEASGDKMEEASEYAGEEAAEESEG
ncbi:leucine-rich repeat-containing protein 37A-like isoform X3 [Eptesicus fuscus]|uniref:leucine-rich repeat-containing protein 37A-like isoform X3 n=1 Tax=Eptesicus fuscus TaxID=29078 RepID=UPI002403A427|nr:leucine-rich repeat-containing protein 37A-like isoform X3 [Eptesicus fuscus]